MAESHIETSAGALLVGNMIALAIWGISAFQTYLYFVHHAAADELWVKFLVALLWVLDTVHIAFASHAVFVYLVSNYNNPDYLLLINWSLALTIGITAFITFIVHCLFARKVYILNKKNWWIPVVIVFLTTTRLGFGTTSTVQCFKQKTFANLTHYVRWMFTTGLSLAVFSDFFVTASFCYYLAKSKTGFKSMDAILAALMRYTIQSGAATAFVTTVSLLCAATMPYNAIWIAVHFSISKLYTASTVAGLNNRDTLRGYNDMEHNSHRGVTVHISTVCSTTRAPSTKGHSPESSLEMGPLAHTKLEDDDSYHSYLRKLSTSTTKPPHDAE